MKRLLAALLAILLVCSMSFPAFAAEENKEQDVTVKYIVTATGEYRAEIKDGTATADGVTVTDAPASAKTLVVVPIPSSVSEAYEWFTECLEKVGNPLAAYEVYFLDADGNRISADGANVSIGCSANGDLTVCTLTTGGSYQDLNAEIKNGSAAFTANSGDYFILTEKKSTEPKPDGDITVPVRGEENEIHADATVDGDTVKLHDLDFEEIDHIVGDHVNTGIVEIDLTDLDEGVCKIILPVTTIEHIVEAAEEAHNDTEALQIDFPHGSVKLDDKAMRAVVEQAECNEIILVLENVGETRLNDTQKQTVADWNVYGGYEAYLFCVKGNKRISDFDGGVATLSVPFEIPNGLKAEKFAVWYVADDGKTEKLETWYEDGKLCWSVDHFSDFIIVYEGNETPTNPPATGDNTMIWLWIVVVAATTGLIFFLVFWKRRKREEESELK